MRNYIEYYILLIFIIISVGGCSTAFTSLKKDESGLSSIMASTEEEVMGAAFEAISREFPSAVLRQLAGYQIGYSWYHQPFLDRTNYKFVISNVKGESVDGKVVVGLSYSVDTQGTQGLVDARYIQPLVTQFDAVLLERGINKIKVSKIIYSKFSSRSSGGSSSSNNKDKSKLVTGTGFFISSDGYIITNHHVIKTATNVLVKLHNGKIIDAVVVQVDPVNDIALLKCDTSSIALNIISSSVVQKGEQVLTLGYPLIGIQGQEQKATFGRVNALSGMKGDIRYMQIDIPIQPGNSGGPLINENGEVVGVITATLDQVNILRATGSLPQSVNYAVKSDYILPVVSGKVTHDMNISKAKQSKAMKDLVRNSEKSVVLVIAK